MKFDKKDKIILESLFQDCRITIKELSRRTNLTHPAIIYRIKKFEERGFIDKYDAVINLNKFEILFRIIFVSVPQKFQKSFESYCIKNKALMSVIRHIHKFNYSVSSPLTKKQEEDLIKYFNRHKLKYKNYKIIKVFSLSPRIFEDVDIPEKEIKFTNKKLKLDKKDIQLIEILFDSGGRDSILELARKTKLSADLVLYRFKKLNKAGYFDKYIAQPNLEKFQIKYEIISFEVKNIDAQDCVKALKKTNKCIYLFQSEKNKYLATLVIRDLKELEETLEKIHNELDDDLVSLELFPMKNWLFLNRLDLEKVLMPLERKYSISVNI